jgi:hemerythrin
MAYIWSDKLEIGNAAIDAQHKQFVIRLNDFFESCISGQGRDKLNSAMKYLIDYTTKHFSDEEKLQLQHNYPNYAYHKQLHDDFKITVGELAKQLDEEGVSISLLAKVYSNIGGWFFNHIQREDKRIAEHIRAA